FYDGVQNSFDRIIGSVSEDFQKELTEGFELAKNRRVTAAKIRDAVFDEKTGTMTYSPIRGQVQSNRVKDIASRYGVFSQAESGAGLESVVLETINKYTDELIDFVKLDDVSDQQAIDAFLIRAREKGKDLAEAEKIAASLKGEKLLPPMVGNPTYARAIYESMDGFKRGIGEFKKFAVDNWQQQIPALSDDLEKVLANAPK
ncbi:MAG: hypothetical protein GY755_25695, partial [Chloroflexi bacterium]|nr:hypothetical protein [Chloroflexota bacterium]